MLSEVSMETSHSQNLDWRSCQQALPLGPEWPEPCASTVCFLTMFNRCNSVHWDVAEPDQPVGPFDVSFYYSGHLMISSAGKLCLLVFEPAAPEHL